MWYTQIYRYHNLNGKKLNLNITTQSSEKCDEISIGPDYLNEVIVRKLDLDFIISFQKIEFRVK